MTATGTSTGALLYLRSSTATSQSVMLTSAPNKAAAPSAADKAKLNAVANAVYGYVQAIRALDRKRVTTGEVARALGLPETSVLAAISLLASKGVKIAK